VVVGVAATSSYLEVEEEFHAAWSWELEVEEDLEAAWPSELEAEEELEAEGEEVATLGRCVQGGGGVRERGEEEEKRVGRGMVR
jgi:hypothetical protein